MIQQGDATVSNVIIEAPSFQTLFIASCYFEWCLYSTHKFNDITKEVRSSRLADFSSLKTSFKKLVEMSNKLGEMRHNLAHVANLIKKRQLCLNENCIMLPDSDRIAFNNLGTDYADLATYLKSCWVLKNEMIDLALNRKKPVKGLEPPTY